MRATNPLLTLTDIIDFIIPVPQEQVSGSLVGKFGLCCNLKPEFPSKNEYKNKSSQVKSSRHCFTASLDSHRIPSHGPKELLTASALSPRIASPGLNFNGLSMQTKKNDAEELKSVMLPQMLSGAMAGLVSRVISAPLDVVKIRFQLQDPNSPKYVSLGHAVKRIIDEEGILGLWKGNTPAVYLWVTYSAVQFMMYGEMKRCGDAIAKSVDIKDSSTPAHAVVNFVSGAASGIVATTVTYPFDIMRTQFAIQGERVVHMSIWQFVTRTYAQNQFTGFFHGLPAAVVGIIPFMGFNFTIYEFLKEKGQALHEAYYAQHSSPSAPSFESMIISGLAGGVAGGGSKLLVYPFDTMKKRMQVQVLKSTFQEPPISSNSRSTSSSNNHQMFSRVVGHKVVGTRMTEDYSTLRRCFLTILRKEGFLSFYKGIVPTVAKSVVSTAVTFFVYEVCVLSWEGVVRTLIETCV